MHESQPSPGTQKRGFATPRQSEPGFESPVWRGVHPVVEQILAKGRELSRLRQAHLADWTKGSTASFRFRLLFYELLAVPVVEHVDIFHALTLNQALLDDIHLGLGR